MELGEFKTFHKWDAEDFRAFVAGFDFPVTEHSSTGSDVVPLSYLEARRDWRRKLTAKTTEVD